MGSEKRNSAIDFYKFIFAVIIFILHFRGYSSFESSKGEFNGGYLAVEFFFIVNGYLMMHEYCCRNQNSSPETLAVHFLDKRYRRLYPQYLLAIIATFFIRIILEDGFNYSRVLIQSIPEILGVQIFYRPGTIFGPLWFVSGILWGGFLIYYLLCRFKESMIKIVFPLIFFIFLGWSYSNFGTLDISYSDFFLGRFIRGTIEIAWGTVLFFITSELKKWISKYRYKIIILGGIETISILGILYIMYYTRREYTDFVAILLISLLICVTFIGEGFLSKILNNPISKYLGSISYSMYVSQAVVQKIFIYKFSGMSFWRATFMAIILDIILAITINAVIKIVKKYDGTFREK